MDTSSDLPDPINRRVALAQLTGLGLAAWPGAQALAQGQAAPYPSRTVRVIVASVPGGSLDMSGRPVFAKLQERLGAPFVLEHRGGVNAAIEPLARSAPDGHTLMVAANSNFFAADQVVRVPFDVRTRIIPVAQLVSSTFMVMVNNDLPVHSVAELIAYAKANPNVLNYAHIPASAAQLAAELLKMRAGIQMQGVGFKGVGPGYVEQMAGRIHVTIGTATSAMPLVKAGKIRAIAVTSPTRTRTLPHIPAMRETIPDFDVFDAWVGVFAVEGTPPAIVATLNREINQILNTPEMQKTLTAEGTEPAPGPPEQLRQALATGLDTGRAIVKQANLKFE